MSLFKKSNMLYIINQEETESYEKFIDRGNFISSQLPTNDAMFLEALKFSRLYVNVKYLNCKYDDHVMKELNKKIIFQN